MIITFPSYTHLMCIDAEIFIFLLQTTSQPVSVKVDQAVLIGHFNVVLTRLQEKSISGCLKNVLNKS